MPDLIKATRVAPQVRMLSKLAAQLKRVRGHAVHAKKMKNVKKPTMHAQPTETAWSNNADGTAARGCCGKRAWTIVPPHLISRLKVGDVVNIRPTEGGHEALEGEIVEVIPLLHQYNMATEVLHCLRTKSGAITYHRLSDSGWSLKLLEAHSSCEGSASPPCVGSGETLDGATWPDCIRQAETIQGVDSAGTFVNLATFGIKEGCFR